MFSDWQRRPFVEELSIDEPGLHALAARIANLSPNPRGFDTRHRWLKIVTERRETIATHPIESVECTLIALRGARPESRR